MSVASRGEAPRPGQSRRAPVAEPVPKNASGKILERDLRTTLAHLAE